MLELIIDGYKFVGYSKGIVMVYKGNLYIDSFIIYRGIESMDALTHEAKQYLEFI